MLQKRGDGVELLLANFTNCGVAMQPALLMLAQGVPVTELGPTYARPEVWDIVDPYQTFMPLGALVLRASHVIIELLVAVCAHTQGRLAFAQEVLRQHVVPVLELPPTFQAKDLLLFLSCPLRVLPRLGVGRHPSRSLLPLLSCWPCILGMKKGATRPILALSLKPVLACLPLFLWRFVA